MLFAGVQGAEWDRVVDSLFSPNAGVIGDACNLRLRRGGVSGAAGAHDGGNVSGTAIGGNDIRCGGALRGSDIAGGGASLVSGTFDAAGVVGTLETAGNGGSVSHCGCDGFAPAKKSSKYSSSVVRASSIRPTSSSFRRSGSMVRADKKAAVALGSLCGARRQLKNRLG